jgi:hypothetical protein
MPVVPVVLVVVGASVEVLAVLESEELEVPSSPGFVHAVRARPRRKRGARAELIAAQ